MAARVAHPQVLAPPDALLVASFGLQPGDDVIAEEVTGTALPSPPFPALLLVTLHTPATPVGTVPQTGKRRAQL